MTRGPILFDLDDEKAARPDIAPAVPDLSDHPQGAAMQHVAAIATHRPSRLARWFWSLALALTGFVVSLAAWDYVNTLLARSPILGGIATGLIALLIGVSASQTTHAQDAPLPEVAESPIRFETVAEARQALASHVEDGSWR